MKIDNNDCLFIEGEKYGQGKWLSRTRYCLQMEADQWFCADIQYEKKMYMGIMFKYFKTQGECEKKMKWTKSKSNSTYTANPM